MKRLIQKFTWLSSLALLVFMLLLPSRVQAQQAEVSFQVFYDELAPHGRWLLHPKHGDVWAPNVQGEFTPYLTNGYWTVTQYGNTWVSNYDWGWATFHYGRWYFDEFEGWVWIPDTTWAPAWVVWRNGGGYYGWAPMSPGLNFSISFSLFNNIPNNYWCFVPQQYVWRPYVYRYCSPRHRNVYIVNNTTYVTHYYGDTYNYYSGPSHADITHATRRPVVINRVEHGDRPGRTQFDREKIIMYKPVVTRNSNEKPNTEQGNYSDRSSFFQDGKRPVKGGSDNNNTGNNGHGNGDQNAPGNSGSNNNGENSENSGQGNSGNGKGNSRQWSTNDDNRSSYFNRDEKNSESGSESNRSTTTKRYNTGTLDKSSNSSSGWNSNRSNNTNYSKSTSGSGNNGSSRTYTPNRTTSIRTSSSVTTRTAPIKSYTVSPSKSSGSSKSSYTPNRSSGGQKGSSSGSGGSRSSGVKKRN